MRTAHDLKEILERIDGRGYKAFKDIKGEYDFGDFALIIDHVQGDPFADPSRVRVRLDQEIARFPEDTQESKSREIALRDFLTRRFFEAAIKFTKGNSQVLASRKISLYQKQVAIGFCQLMPTKE